MSSGAATGTRASIAPRRGGLARRRRFDELERLRGHDQGARHGAGLVAAAARALQEPRHAFRAADLQHLVDRREIDAEIEARRADDGAQPLVAQAVLDPVAHVALERSVVQRDRPRPVGPRLEQRLVPDLGLRADVGEHERGLRALDRADHLRQQLQADVTGPRKALDRARTQAVDDDRLRVEALDDDRARAAAAGPTRHASASSRLRERRREPPHAQRRKKAAQPRERELGLHAALGPHELVPLVDDDRRRDGRSARASRPGPGTASGSPAW